LAGVAVGFVAGRFSSTYLLPACVAALIAGLALFAPHLCLYALLFGLPVSVRFFLPNRSEVQVPSEPLIAALVGAYALDRLIARARGRERPAYPLWAPLVFFAFGTAASVVQTPFPFASVKGVVRALTYQFLALPVFSLLRDRAAFLRAARVGYTAAALAALAMVPLLLSRLPDLGHTRAYRGTLFTNYSVYGSYVSVFLLPLLARWLFDTTRFNRAGHFALLGLFGVAMLLCWSRGAWLSLVVAAAFLLAHRAPAGSGRKWAIFALAVAGALLLVLVVPATTTAFVGRLATLTDPDYASNRTRILRAGFALLLFARSPILGSGYGTFALLYPNEPFLGENARYQMGSHNEHLQVLAETGLLGFVGWVWLNGAFFVHGFRLVRRLQDPFWRSATLGLMAYEIALLMHFAVGNFLAGDAIAVPYWFAFGALPAVEAVAASERFAASSGGLPPLDSGPYDRGNREGGVWTSPS
jgi:O-antigen ligase